MVRARAAGSLQAGGGAERLRVCGQVSYVLASPGWTAPAANAEGKATNIGSDTGWWAPGLVWAAEHEVSTRLQNWQNEVSDLATFLFSSWVSVFPNQPRLWSPVLEIKIRPVPALLGAWGK